MQVDLPTLQLVLQVVEIVVLGLSAYLIYREIHANHDWNRRETAHQLIMESNIGRFRELRSKLETKIDIYDRAQTYKTVKANLTDDDRLTLEAILNFLENVCLAIKNKVVDEKIAFESFGAIVVAYRRWADPYIDEWRKIDSGFWIQIDPVAELWDQNRKALQNEYKRRMIGPGKQATG